MSDDQTFAEKAQEVLDDTFRYTLGVRLDQDIPAVVEALTAAHEDRLTAAVEQTRGIAAAVESQNAEALTEWQRDPGRHADASHCLACRMAQALTDGPLDGGEQS